MPGRTGDRLAVSTHCEHGERVAYSDPRTSDAERAAAGRETVAQRFRALLPANRERAAAQYAEGGLPDGQEAARVWLPRDPAALAARLGDQPLTAWAEGGVLHVLESAALGGPRGVTVYLPPGLSGGSPAPGCVLADGQSAADFAAALDAAIRAGTAPPVVLAGVHNAHVHAPDSPGPPRADPRALEYLPHLRSRRFAAHMAFVAGEVIPWVAGQFPVAPGPWTAAGYSNGAVWAVAAGQRRPEVFGQVAALSAGMAPHRIAGRSRQVRHYLGAGTLEGGFRGATSGWAGRLQRAGLPCAYQEWAGGHDPWW